MPQGRGLARLLRGSVADEDLKTRDLSSRNALTRTIAAIETDEGPFAGVSITLDGHGHLFALATRKAIDELGLGPGDRVYALIKTVALDEARWR
jgi:molybdate transport system ATP-binding protein